MLAWLQPNSPEVFFYIQIFLFGHELTRCAEQSSALNAVMLMMFLLAKPAVVVAL
jgi:hypothetical protein